MGETNPPKSSRSDHAFDAARGVADVRAPAPADGSTNTAIAAASKGAATTQDNAAVRPDDGPDVEVGLTVSFSDRASASLARLTARVFRSVPSIPGVLQTRGHGSQSSWN